MRSDRLAVLFGLVLSAPLSAQENPFAFTGGGVKSAYIVYDMVSKQPSAGTGTYEVGVTPDRWIMRIVSPYELAGKKDTMRALVVTSRDSQYTYTGMGGQGEGAVSPTLRPYLEREYAALDRVGKGRFRQNLKLAAEASGSSDADRFPWLTGEKAGSETVAGYKCDVYKSEKSSACVLPQAPAVMLRWNSEKDGVNLVAKKVTLNGPIPPALSVLPKGISWKKKPYDDADFVMNIWALKKQSDPAAVPPSTLTQFAVRYLASPQAGPELREMQAASGEASESGQAPPEDSTNNAQ
jgi:hypothetical protein